MPGEYLCPANECVENISRYNFDMLFNIPQWSFPQHFRQIVLSVLTDRTICLKFCGMDLYDKVTAFVKASQSK